MSDYYLGEIRTFPFSWPPEDWALCNGAILPVNQNQALSSLLGVQFGGTPGTNFGLPDLRGRSIMGYGGSYITGATSPAVGTKAGTETVALTAANQIPAHIHALQASSTAGNNTSSAGNVLAKTTPKTTGLTVTPYAATANLTAMSPNSIVATTSASAPHDNMQPYTVINYSIAISGLYPMRP